MSGEDYSSGYSASDKDYTRADGTIVGKDGWIIGHDSTADLPSSSGQATTSSGGYGVRVSATTLDRGEGEPLQQFFFDFFRSFLSRWVLLWIATVLFVVVYGRAHNLIWEPLVATTIISNRTARNVILGCLVLVVIAAVLAVIALFITSNAHVGTSSVPAHLTPTARPHVTPHK